MENLPTDRELEALKILWRRGGATVRDIYQQINEGGEQLAYTTVLSLLQVMEQKDLVGHRKEGKTYRYFPKIERVPTIRKMAAGFLDRVFEGAVDEYLVHALDGKRPGREEIERLEKAVAEAKAKTKGARQKKTREGNS